MGFGCTCRSGSDPLDRWDMLTYLQANLHPENLKSVAGSSAAATISAALIQSHQLRADVGPGTRIALAWLYEAETGSYWHNGGTGGYSSYASFNPKATMLSLCC